MSNKFSYGRPMTAVVGSLLVGGGALGLYNLQGSGGYILKVYAVCLSILGVGLIYGAAHRSAAFYWILSRTFALGALVFLLLGSYSVIAGVVNGGELAVLFIAILGGGGLLFGAVCGWLSYWFEQDRQHESTPE